jgi:hypothetical protein
LLWSPSISRLALPPQARVHGFATVGVEEPVRVRVPNDAPVGGSDDPVRQGSDPPPPGVVEVLGVRERQACMHGGVRLGDVVRGLGERFDGHQFLRSVPMSSVAGFHWQRIIRNG